MTRSKNRKGGRHRATAVNSTGPGRFDNLDTVITSHIEVPNQALPFMLVLCVLCSGAAGLIYEVVWSRQLTVFLGTTAYSHMAVLTAFMSGLAAGSYWLGNIADRVKNHLKWYALIEIGIGVYALFIPLILLGLNVVYIWMIPVTGVVGPLSDIARFGLALVFMLIPTFLMGGTLPLLVKGFTNDIHRVGGSTAKLYGINTLGATLGAFAAGYLLIPNLGINASSSVAVGLNIFAGVVVLYFAKRWQIHDPSDVADLPVTDAQTDSQKILTTTESRFLLLGFALSGFAALLYQSAWIKALILVIGSSVYAFSATLTVFLAGISIGSFIAIRIVRTVTGRKLLRFAAVVQLLLAIAALGCLALLGKMPEIFIAGYNMGLVEGFAIYQFFQFGLSFMVMLAPTILMGVLFPIIVRLRTESASELGSGVGLAYASNTFGTILGVLAGGLILLPQFGIENSTVIASAIGVMVASMYWVMYSKNHGVISIAESLVLPAALFVLVFVTVPPWNKLVMQSGPFIYAEYLSGSREDLGWADYLHKHEKLLFYEEGINGVVSVTQKKTQRSMAVNGKVDASSKGDMPTQVLLGQIPMLLHPSPTDAMVIGLGSGATAAAIASHSSVSKLDIVEISPQVVKASNYFTDVNSDVLKDPRVNLIPSDGRNFTSYTNNRYDLIVSEPSNPWISGVSNLFTREFFAAAKTKLNQNGLLAQWFHIYSMSEDDLKSIFATFASEFSYVQVWMPLSSDLILIGSNEPISIDDQTMRRRVADPDVADSLALANIRFVAQIMNTYLLDDTRLRQLGSGGQLNTDNYPVIEFSAPRFLLAETNDSNLKFLFGNSDDLRNAVKVSRMVVNHDKQWMILSAGLKIDPSIVEISEPEAQWLITYRRQDEEEKVIIKNLVYLDWQDDTSQYELIGGIQSGAGNDIATREVLDVYLTAGIERRGPITLQGGVSGYWAYGPHSEQGVVQIAITWECVPEKDWGYQYILRRYLPDFGAEIGKPLVEMAEQVSCIEHDQSLVKDG